MSEAFDAQVRGRRQHLQHLLQDLLSTGTMMEMEQDHPKLDREDNYNDWNEKAMKMNDDIVSFHPLPQHHERLKVTKDIKERVNAKEQDGRCQHPPATHE